MRLRRWNVRYMALVLVLVGVPVVAAGIAITAQEGTRATFDEREDVVTLEVTKTSTADQTPVVLRAVLEDERHVRSGLSGGTVTDVYVRSGDTVAAGMPVIQVDGIDRVAIMGGRPLWRSLSVGMSGSDVVVLQEFLVAGGFLDLGDEQPDGDYGGRTAAAVRLLGKELGIELPSSTAQLDWFLWIPSEPFVVGSVSAEVGANAPAFGTTVLTAVQRALAVEIVASDGTPVRRNDDRPRHVVLEGSSFATATTADEFVVIADPSEIDLTMFDENLVTQADLVLTEPLSVAIIPASAVLQTPTGSCVVRVVATEPGGFEAAQIDVSGSKVNQVEVMSGLEAGDRIVVNPRTAALDSLCF